MNILDILIVEHLTNRVMFFIERFGYHNLSIIETAKGGISYIREDLYDYIFLGGYLGGNNGSGGDVASYLHEEQSNSNNESNIIIHS